MENVLKEALPNEVIEVQEALPLPEKDSGIGWGAGIGLSALVAVLAIGVYKTYCRCKK